jgi:hypothetical protein
VQHELCPGKLQEKTCCLQKEAKTASFPTVQEKMLEWIGFMI